MYAAAVEPVLTSWRNWLRIHSYPKKLWERKFASGVNRRTVVLSSIWNQLHYYFQRTAHKFCYYGTDIRTMKCRVHKKCENETLTKTDKHKKYCRRKNLINLRCDWKLLDLECEKFYGGEKCDLPCPLCSEKAQCKFKPETVSYYCDCQYKHDGCRRTDDLWIFFWNLLLFLQNALTVFTIFCGVAVKDAGANGLVSFCVFRLCFACTPTRPSFAVFVHLGLH